MNLRKHDAGFTLAEIMISVAIAGIISVGVISILKSTSALSIKTQVNSDLTQVQSEIQGFYTVEKNCNANLKGKAVGTNVPIATGIYRCDPPTANCFSTGSEVIKIPITTTSWEQSATKISNRVRLTNLKYSTVSTGTAYAQDSATIDYTLELKNENMVTSLNGKFTVPVIVENGIITTCRNNDSQVYSCSGQWSTCSASCSQTYEISVLKNIYGESCPYVAGAIRACTSGACTAAGACGGTSGVCTSGTASAVTGAACGGNNTWTCSGVNGGANASCSIVNPVACACTWGWTGCIPPWGVQTLTFSNFVGCTSYYQSVVNCTATSYTQNITNWLQITCGGPITDLSQYGLGGPNSYECR